MSNVPKKTTTASKRKLDSFSTAPKKKTHMLALLKDLHAPAHEFVVSMNTSPKTFKLPKGNDEVHQKFVSLATYAKTLEPVEKSSSQIKTEVD